MKPSLHKPSRLVLAAIVLTLAVGVAGIFHAAWQRPRGVPGSRATMQVQADGVAVQFPVSLDTQQAADAGNWSVRNAASREPLRVQAVNVGTDDRSVFLAIPGIKPGMRLTIQYHLKSDAGTELRGEIGE